MSQSAVKLRCRTDEVNATRHYYVHFGQSLIGKVQSVQNAAARLLAGTRPGDHISPVLRQLHWLPVQRRVDFNLICPTTTHQPSHLRDVAVTTATWTMFIVHSKIA